MTRAAGGLAVIVRAAPATNSESTRPRFRAEERAYLLARATLIVVLIVLSALDIMYGTSQFERNMYGAATALLVLDTAVLLVLVFALRMSVAEAMLAVLVPDLIAFAAFTYLGRPDDSFYPVVILAPLFYALVVRNREAWLVGLGAGIAYGVGTYFVGPMPLAQTVLYSSKLLAIPVIAILVANAVSNQRSREEAAEKAAAETERLNAQLSRRVAQLQAVSAISEIIHSSLDFDNLGTQVLDIVATAVGVSTACLFVIDKTRSETLFSASRGTASISDPMAVAFSTSDDEHLTCAPVFDRGSTMVLFCTTAEAFRQFTDEERLVLSAVASELVVAVENSHLYKLTSRLAVTDELTGLANYRHLQQRLDQELARAERFGKPLSLLMFDADDFKAFNDSHGHVAGDVALAELGPIIRGLVREVDLVARYGGEEFSVVLPETDAAGAFIVAEKIRESVELHRFPDADGRRTCSLTVSIGLATYPTHSRDKDSLLRESDDALYHAKNGGKNRVRAPQHHLGASPASAHGDNSSTDEWTGA